MKTILLLHGALGSRKQLVPLREALAKEYDVHLVGFSGHEGEALKTSFSIEGFASEVLDYITKNKLKNVHLVSYSLGGYVALYLAKHHTEVVASVATLGTKLHWDAATAAREVAMLDPEKMKEKVPKFAAELKQRHQPLDWENVVMQTAELMQHLSIQCPLPLHEFSSISCPVLLLLGDRDNMVTVVETVTVFKQLPQGQFGILPSTPHPIEKVNIGQLHCLISNFLKHAVAQPGKAGLAN